MQPGYTNMFGQSIALGLFIGYPQEAQPLILEDLRSTDPQAISRGIYVAGQMQETAAPDLFDDLKRISFSDDPCADQALQSLINYVLRFRIRTATGDLQTTPSSRALDLVPQLVPLFQKQPERYARALESLLPFAPPPKILFSDLESSNPTLRRNAVLILSEARKTIPARYILEFASDRDPAIREASIRLGFEKGRSDFGQLRPALAKLMQDADFGVRLEATESFASLRDPGCALPLLGLLQETNRAGDGKFFTLSRLADSLADRKFGFDSGTERVPMQNKRNAAAIQRYKEWAQQLR